MSRTAPKDRLQNVIRFYKDCYQREYSTEKVLNFYSSSVSNHYYTDTFEFVSKSGWALPVDTSWGEEAAIALEFDSSEKKLVCGSFFLKGQVELMGKRHQIFTPIFLHDVTLRYLDEVYFLELDEHSLSLNPTAINYLNSLHNEFSYSNDDLLRDIGNIEEIFLG